MRRDLEWLLNTPPHADAGAGELRGAVARRSTTSASPDMTSLSATPVARRANDCSSEVEESLAIFEPRLANVRISLVEQDGEARRRELRFVVEGTLRLDPTPEQVAFDTVLHFSTRRDRRQREPEMREELLHYYERELTFLRRMGAEFAAAVSQGRRAAPARAEQMRGSARRAHARGVRVSRGARASQDRRRRSRRSARRCSTSSTRTTCGRFRRCRSSELRLDPEQGKLTTGYPCCRAARCCTRVRSTACPASSRAATTSRCGRSTSPRCSGRRRTAFGRRPGSATPSARAAHRAALPGRRHVRASSSSKSLRFYLDGAGNLTSALYELLEHERSRDRRSRGERVGNERCIGQDDHAAGVGAAAGGTRAQRGDAAVSRPLVRGVPAAAGILRLSREVSLPRSRAASIRSPRRDSAARSRF